MFVMGGYILVGISDACACTHTHTHNPFDFILLINSSLRLSLPLAVTLLTLQRVALLLAWGAPKEVASLSYLNCTHKVATS